MTKSIVPMFKVLVEIEGVSDMAGMTQAIQEGIHRSASKYGTVHNVQVEHDGYDPEGYERVHTPITHKVLVSFTQGKEELLVVANDGLYGDDNIQWVYLPNILHVHGECANMCVEDSQVVPLLEGGVLQALADHMENVPWNDDIDYDDMCANPKHEECYGTLSTCSTVRVTEFEYTADYVTLQVVVVI